MPVISDGGKVCWRASWKGYLPLWPKSITPDDIGPYEADRITGSEFYALWQTRLAMGDEVGW